MQKSLCHSFNKIAFFSHEQKIGYMLKNFEVDSFIDEILRDMSTVTNKLFQANMKINLSLKSCLSRIYYIMNYENVVKDIDDICILPENTKAFYSLFMKRFFRENLFFLLGDLKSLHGIDFSEIKFIEAEDNMTIAEIDGNRYFFDDIEGIVHSNFYINFFFDIKLINSMIDCLAVAIKRDM